MKVRCPSCRSVFELAVGTEQCPQCGRKMVIPKSLRYQAALPTPEATKSPQAKRVPGEALPAAAVPAAEPSRRSTRFFSRTRLLVWVIFCVFMAWWFIPNRWSPRYQKLQKQQMEKREQAAVSVVNLGKALEMFHRDCGRYPTEQEQLAALIADPGAPGWSGPYVTALHPDPWGRPFGLTSDGHSARVFSLGADGKPGTDDDITVACPAPRNAE